MHGFVTIILTAVVAANHQDGRDYMVESSTLGSNLVDRAFDVRHLQQNWDSTMLLKPRVKLDKVQPVQTHFKVSHPIQPTSSAFTQAHSDLGVKAWILPPHPLITILSLPFADVPAPRTMPVAHASESGNQPSDHSRLVKQAMKLDDRMRELAVVAKTVRKAAAATIIDATELLAAADRAEEAAMKVAMKGDPEEDPLDFEKEAAVAKVRATAAKIQQSATEAVVALAEGRFYADTSAQSAAIAATIQHPYPKNWINSTRRLPLVREAAWMATNLTNAAAEKEIKIAMDKIVNASMAVAKQPGAAATQVAERIPGRKPPVIKEETPRPTNAPPTEEEKVKEAEDVMQYLEATDNRYPRADEMRQYRESRAKATQPVEPNKKD
eukprot:gnl/MRDRNA2_/MRDRNA2_34228_c0_seq1.p1 gnl/MRDRNA2_/MRDRNA2_34228_c0~~gnl/MRDRNA2_/MRDRNA2_34228_c0_seq1.p1  ORF type:complete len:382 (+),score=92.55 gnl/MRDRNA2_/MRDRNA2_34228_c0_seq1:101-1246(+)